MEITQTGKKKIVINTRWCKGCDICAEFCPAGAIVMINGKAAAEGSACIGCGQCVLRCPDYAVAIEEE